MFEPTTPHPQLFLPTHGVPQHFPQKVASAASTTSIGGGLVLRSSRLIGHTCETWLKLPPCLGAMDGVFRQGFDVFLKPCFGWITSKTLAKHPCFLLVWSMFEKHKMKGCRSHFSFFFGIYSNDAFSEMSSLQRVGLEEDDCSKYQY